MPALPMSSRAPLFGSIALAALQAQPSRKRRRSRVPRRFAPRQLTELPRDGWLTNGGNLATSAIRR